LRGRGRSDGDRFYVKQLSDYSDDVSTFVDLAKGREPGLPVFVLGHSAGGVASCLYTLDHQAQIAGLICESFAFQVYAPDFALPVLILHGTEDKLTKPSGSQLFFDAVGSRDKTLKLYEGHVHDLLNDVGKEVVMEDIQSWLDGHISA